MPIKILGNNLGKVKCVKTWFAVKLPDLKNCSAKFRRKRPRKWPKSSRRTDETFSVSFLVELNVFINGAVYECKLRVPELRSLS